MSETVMKTIDVAPSAAPATIPGYELKERIGSGGYGEVWRALAPGGVQKAVKFVYGNVDESRGATELKSLERIKDARHPFLLVLERFDVVDGRLVVVTELAEGSLKDRFDEHRAQGKPGIPRNELLEYLRDSADALDYMFEKHGLAHLDIKPENILLVGGRAKVADFGLTKDISRESMSIMNGLTPQFAAPEIFEGRATRHSDQYSLAIVYQILLTGQPPFNGRTAAQLTAQHLHSTPSLSSLPPSDRAPIARALSKNPSQRFETCRQLVEELLDRPGRRATPERANPERRPGPSRRAAAAEDVPSQITARFGQAPPPASRDQFLPPVEPTGDPPRPAILIGIGGVGRRVLERIESRSPNIRRLLFDCDPREISKVNRLEGKDRHGVVATAMPLRTSADYRHDSSRWLEWIDRRWLYNVPRSMQTEGIRPLGRLACLDHEAELEEEIVAGLGELPSDSPEPPIVFVVGASSGGTGSGAMLDVAQLARRASERINRKIDCRAVLVHAKRPNTANGDLADANTLALLSELRHADAERRTAIECGNEPSTGFSSVHLVDAGDTGDEDVVNHALDSAKTFLDRVLTGNSGLDRTLARSDSQTIGTAGFAPVPGVEATAIAALVDRIEAGSDCDGPILRRTS